jgi:hypothetical protein
LYSISCSPLQHFLGQRPRPPPQVEFFSPQGTVNPDAIGFGSGILQRQQPVQDASGQGQIYYPMPASIKLFPTLLSKNRQKLSDLNNSFVFGDQVLFHAHGTAEINQITFQAYLYFNDRRRSEEVAAFLRKILELETAAQQQSFQTKEEAREYLSSQGPVKIPGFCFTPACDGGPERGEFRTG